MNGPTTDLQRTCNGPALEGVGSSRRISLKPVLIFGKWFWNGFHVFSKDNVHNVIAIENNRIIVTGAFFTFSSILNKVNQPEISAYCYAVETIGRLYSILYFAPNSLIIFSLQ